ncbi:hypothetical protein HG530_014680 [Fusarium avenaceum]|nr:hypothetical protein HG530_014680 [Fusarium avenaceum]
MSCISVTGPMEGWYVVGLPRITLYHSGLFSLTFAHRSQSKRKYMAVENGRPDFRTKSPFLVLIDSTTLPAMFYNFLKDSLDICPVFSYHVGVEGNAVVFVMTNGSLSYCLRCALVNGNLQRKLGLKSFAILSADIIPFEDLLHWRGIILDHFGCWVIVANRQTIHSMKPFEKIPDDVLVRTTKHGWVMLLRQMKRNGVAVRKGMIKKISSHGWNLSFWVDLQVLLVQIFVSFVVDEAQCDTLGRHRVVCRGAKLDRVTSHHGVEGEWGRVERVLCIFPPQILFQLLFAARANNHSVTACNIQLGMVRDPPKSAVHLSEVMLSRSLSDHIQRIEHGVVPEAPSVLAALEGVWVEARHGLDGIVLGVALVSPCELTAGEWAECIKCDAVVLEAWEKLHFDSSMNSVVHALVDCGTNPSLANTQFAHIRHFPCHVVAYTESVELALFVQLIASPKSFLKRCISIWAM